MSLAQTEDIPDTIRGMKLPIRSSRPYDLAVVHHVPIVYNRIKVQQGIRGTSDKLIETVPTITGWNQIRGWAVYAAQQAITLWEESSRDTRTPLPTVDIWPATNLHCANIGIALKVKIENEHTRRLVGRQVAAVLHKTPSFASLDPGLLKTPYWQLSPSEQAAVRRFDADNERWKAGKRANMPHPPLGSMSPRQHLREVAAGLEQQAHIHIGQFALNIVTSSTWHASKITLDAPSGAKVTTMPYPYVEVPEPGYGHIYRISTDPPLQLTDNPVTYSLRPGAPHLEPHNAPYTQPFNDASPRELQL